MDTFPGSRRASTSPCGRKPSTDRETSEPQATTTENPVSPAGALAHLVAEHGWDEHTPVDPLMVMAHKLAHGRHGNLDLADADLRHDHPGFVAAFLSRLRRPVEPFEVVKTWEEDEDGNIIDSADPVVPVARQQGKYTGLVVTLSVLALFGACGAWAVSQPQTPVCDRKHGVQNCSTKALTIEEGLSTASVARIRGLHAVGICVSHTPENDGWYTYEVTAVPGCDLGEYVPSG
jgi:hypothetical protein